MKRYGKIKSITSKRRARLRVYAIERKFFLANNPWCAWGLRQMPPVHIRSTEVHHSRGKVGRLLLDQRFWFAISSKAHDWVHNHPKDARAMGLLCAVGLWNTPEPL